MKRWTDDERPMIAACYDCGMPYTDPAWVETSVPDEIWEIINPTFHKGGGLLCIHCIARRCIEAGLKDVPVRIVGGVFISLPS